MCDFSHFAKHKSMQILKCVTSKHPALPNRIVWNWTKGIEGKKLFLKMYNICSKCACMCVNHFTLNNSIFSSVWESKAHDCWMAPMPHANVLQNHLSPSRQNVLAHLDTMAFDIKCIQKQISNLIWSASYVNVVRLRIDQMENKTQSGCWEPITIQINSAMRSVRIRLII